MVSGLRFTLMIVFCVLSVGVASQVPIFEASDEAEHFLYAYTLQRDGTLPLIRSRDELAALDADPIARWNNQSHHAPLYYLLAAPLIALAPPDDLAAHLQANPLVFLRDSDPPHKWLHPPGTSATHAAVWRLRLLNIALSALTLLIIERAAYRLTGKRELSLLAMAVAALQPTFIALSGSMSNDPLTIFLYSAGLLWCVRLLTRRAIRQREAWVMALILAGLALTKLTGLSLFGVVTLTLFISAGRGDISWRWALTVLFLAFALTALLSGWWYLRNWTLYGDPLALSATRALWGRELILESAAGFTLAEALRLGRSFWFMVGYLHHPVYAPDALSLTATLAALVSVPGVILAARRHPAWRAPLLVLMSAAALVTLQLLVGTLSVDISYGRLLLPALMAFAVLVALGWRMILGRYLAWLLLLAPLSIALTVIVHTLPAAYPRLELNPALPAEARRIQGHTDGWHLTALGLPESPLQPGDALTVQAYFGGRLQQDAAFTLTAVDPLTGQRLGYGEYMPGMASLAQLDDDTRYRAPLRLILDQMPSETLRPRQITLQFRLLDPATEDVYLALRLPDGQITDPINLSGPVFRDPAYPEPERGITRAVHFGEQIHLLGFQALGNNFILEPGQRLDLRFTLARLRAMSTDYRLTVQLFDHDGQLAAQNDGAIPAYPTSLWLEGAFAADWSLSLPDDLRPGAYTLWLGWYHPESLQRLPITASVNHRDGLVRLARVMVR